MDKTKGSPTIEKLIPDIQELLSRGKEVTDEAVERLASNIASLVHRRLHPVLRERTFRLSPSNLGTEDRKLWLAKHKPELADPLPPEARLKFLYGDILEELLFFLAEEAGHTVTDRSKKVQLDDIEGEIDGKIDGVLVDTKSASSFGFNKFSKGLTEETDSFNYLDQINAYMRAEKTDRSAFFVVDKTLGKMCLDFHTPNSKDYSQIIADKLVMLNNPEPPRCYEPVPDGKSGNMKLDTVCSYCAFKDHCYPEHTVYLYSNGPRFLTRVVRKPDVPVGNRHREETKEKF